MAEPIIRLGQFDSKGIFDLETREPGVYEQQLSVGGSSLLSSVFVSSLDPGATILVDYWDYGVGRDLGEKYVLGSHDLIETAPKASGHVLISNIHDKPVARVTISGGNATFGVYITVSQSSATDIDNALQREGDSVDKATDKGIPIVVYDEANEVWRFARGELGIQDVRIVGNVAVGEPGTPFFLEYSGDSKPGENDTILSYTVPSNARLNLLQVSITSTFDTKLLIYAGGDLIGSARTSPANTHVIFSYRIARTLSSGTLLEVKALTGSWAPVDAIECFVQGTISGS